MRLRSLAALMALTAVCFGVACDEPADDPNDDTPGDGSGTKTESSVDEGAGTEAASEGCPKTLTADCNGDEADGCEQDLSNDVNNCGRCGRACRVPPEGTHAGVACIRGRCIVACDEGLGDCDQVITNGCEQDLLSDARHCGSCGYACEGESQCVSGGCSCAAQSVEARIAPLDLFFLIDRSTSMTGAPDSQSDPGPGEDSRWDILNNAVLAFFNQSTSVGINVAWGVFPAAAAESDDYCARSKYAQPVQDFAPLPEPVQSYRDTIAATSYKKIQGTPTWAAAPGAIDGMKARVAAFPDHKVAVILLTDGEPTKDCLPDDMKIWDATTDELLKRIGAELAAGREAGIPTYVVGIGPSLDKLNVLAQSGSGRDAFLVANGMSAFQDFVEALRKIREQLLGCEYALPSAEEGALVDPDKLSIHVTNDGGEKKPERVDDAAACGEAGGWYFDNDDAPTKLLLCPKTCEMVQEDATAKVGIELGCDAETQDNRG